MEFSDNAILTIIRKYTREAGVRNLERELAAIMRKVAKEVAKEGTKSSRSTPRRCPSTWACPSSGRRTEEDDEVGVATGLAWTEMGGELLQIEVSIVPGKGKHYYRQPGRRHAGIGPGRHELHPLALQGNGP